MPNLFASNGESAEEIARLFLMERLGDSPSSGTIEAVKVSDKMAKKASAKDLSADFFSYNGKMRNSDCFVLMMNSESGMQVIGYGDNGKLSLDNMPDAMREMLTYIKEAKAAGANSWGGPTCKPVAPLIKTQWGQGKPFNNACPTKNGEHYVTGCCATALAQVLNYWKSDNKGFGVIEYVDQNSSKEISVDFSKVSYNWNKMLDIYEEGKYTAEQAEEVARLMYECGVACKAQYGYATGAAPPYVALEQYYNFKAKFMFRSYQPTDAWMKTIQKELLAGRPIIYGGSSHIFILDGIDSENFVHINWGWDGEADGYYDITYCKPSNSDNFYSGGATMIVGISPRKAGDAPYQARPECIGITEKYRSDFGRRLVIEGVTANTYGPYEYYVDFALVADGEIKYKPAKDKESRPDETVFPSYTNKNELAKNYEGNLVDGNYELRPVYRTSIEEDWKLMPMNENGICTCVIKNGEFTWKKPYNDKPETFLLDVKPLSELIGKTDMWLEVSAIQKSGAIHDPSGNPWISFPIKFVSVENGKVYKVNKYVDFVSGYADITDTAIIGPICPTNPDNGFRIPGGKYKVVPDNDNYPEWRHVKTEKDFFVELKPQVDYPILSFGETARLRRSTEYQHQNISMFCYLSVANNTDGKVSVNVYACPVDGGKEILLSTIRDIQPFQGAAPVATLDLDQPYNYYPLEGGYVFKVRQLTPDGERDTLCPFIEERTEYIYPSTHEMPKLVLSPVSARMAASIEPNQPSKIKAEIMNQGSFQVSGTVTAYIYEKSKGIAFEAESNPVTIDVNGKATATFDVQFPTDGVYEIYFRAFENKIMVLDMSSDQAVMTVTVGNGGISDMAAPSLKLYPNPATEVLNIEGLTVGDNLEIYTADGQKVVAATATTEKEVINIKDLQPGIYILNINGKAQKFVKK